MQQTKLFICLSLVRRYYTPHDVDNLLIVTRLIKDGHLYKDPLLEKDELENMYKLRFATKLIFHCFLQISESETETFAEIMYEDPKPGQRGKSV